MYFWRFMWFATRSFLLKKCLFWCGIPLFKGWFLGYDFFNKTHSIVANCFELFRFVPILRFEHENLNFSLKIQIFRNVSFLPLFFISFYFPITNEHNIKKNFICSFIYLLLPHHTIYGELWLSCKFFKFRFLADLHVFGV